MKIHWYALEHVAYRGWTARQLLDRKTESTFAIRKAPNGGWWVTHGLDIKIEKYAGPFRTVEDARTTAEMLLHMGME